MKQAIWQRLFLFLILTCLAGALMASEGSQSSFEKGPKKLASEWPGNHRDNPVEPEATAAFMANGIFDPADLTYVAPTGDDFDEIIMDRDEAAKAERRDQAVLYFIARFGIDFSAGDVAQDGNIILVHGYQDPRWNYRAYKLPGVHFVPPYGLIVHESQYNMIVVGPEATLYGSWGGGGDTVVPGGTVAVDGEYLIQGTDRFRLGHPKNIYIHFESTSPIFNALSGRATFDCRLDSQQFGRGLALVRFELYPLADGKFQVSAVNILQFPATQWAVEQDD